MDLRFQLMDFALKSRQMTHQAEIQHDAILNSDEFKTAHEIFVWLQWLTGGLKPLVKLIEDYIGIVQPLATFNRMLNMLAINLVRRRDEMEALHANIYLEHQNPLINPSSSCETNRITAPAPVPQELQVLAS
jgi:hypothetical protein